MQEFLRPVLYVVGLFLTGLGAIMIIPGLIDLAASDRDAEVFFVSAAITVFVGSMLAMTNRGDVAHIDARQGYLITTIGWLAACVFCAVPFWLSRLGMSITDSIFESTSGLTTTGASTLSGLDDAPGGILMWRALLNGMGGIGIVVMAVLILPFLKVGGQQLFRTESSDKSERPFPRFGKVVSAISMVYAALILFTASALWLGGMSAFDAIAHAMAAIATGGFSTKDASVGYWNSAVLDWILIVAMIAGALPLTWYVRVLRNGASEIGSDPQIRSYLIVLVLCIASMVAWVLSTQDIGFGRALTLAAFNVTSIITDTGFAHDDYGTWGSFAVASFMMYAFIGGCTGSTAGAIKIFRWQIAFGAFRRTLLRSLSENRVLPATYNRGRVTPEIVNSVYTFILLYFLTFAAATVALSVFGVDFLSAASGVAACMANSGPGLGDIIGPAGNYKALPDAAKWVLSLAMLLGRLELLTVMVLLFPSFWRT